MDAVTDGRRSGPDRMGGFATAPFDASSPVEVVGAGPAGRAAAITLARNGRGVAVREARHEVGYRFRRDLQGLEDWSGRRDVLDELRDVGLSTDFDVATCAHGVQDALAGFGMRHAMLSRVLAARSLMDGTDCDASWRREIKRPMETARVNRAIYGGLGNHGYRWLLRAQAWTAYSRALLGWLYRSARPSRPLLPWAQRRLA